MVLNFFTFTASAASNAFQATKSTVQTGDTFQVTFTQPKTLTVSSLSFAFTFDKGTFEITSFGEIPYKDISPKPESSNNAGKVSFGYTDSNLAATIEIKNGTKLVTVNFKVRDGATSGPKAFTITEYVVKGNYNEATYSTEDITPTDAEIGQKTLTVEVVSNITGNLPVDITAPVKGKVPQSAIAAATQYTGAITWEGNPATFAANTEYTANVTLTANTGYQFADGVNPTVAGANSVTGVNVKDSGSKLEFKATFPKTADKDPLTGTVSLNSTAWRIGNSMTVGTSGITSTSPGTLSYKWYRVDYEGNESPIEGESGSSYTPSVAADVGKNIKVVVTAENYSGKLEATSLYTVSKKPYDGLTPTAPTITIKKSDFVGFNKTDNYYYVVTSATTATAPSSGWTNQDGFSSLTPNTQYKLWYRVGETDIMESSSAFYVEFTTLKSSATITIADPGTIVYDGSAVEVGSGKDLSYTYSGDAGTVTVKWYADNNNSVGSPLAGAPTNAGTYWIGVSAAEGTSSAAVSEVTQKFTISQKALTNDMITLGTQATYDGSAHDPVYSVKDGTTVLNKGTDYIETSGFNPLTNVGNMTLGISGAGNYTGEASATWSLVAKNIGDPSVSITLNPTSYDYTGDAITPDPEVKDGTTPLTKGTDYTVSCTNNTNAGTATLTINGTGNYTGTKTDSFTITSKNVSSLTATISDQTTIKGVGEFVAPVIKGVKDEVLTGTLTYAYDGVSGKSHADVVNMLKGKNVNDVVTLTYTFTPPSGNYTGTKTDSFKVTVKDIEFLVGTAPASVGNTLTVKSSPVYGDNWSDIVKIKDGVTITAKVGTNIDTEQSHFTLRPTGKPNAASGQTYELVYNGTINSTTYTNVVVVSGTVDVAPKTLTAADLTYSSPITKVYDGNDSAPTGLSISVKPTSLVSGDTLTVTGTLKYNSANVNEANKITFTPDAITTGNYALAATEVLTITGAKITQATPTYTAPTGLTAKYGQTLADVNIAATTGWSWMNSTQPVGDVSTTPKTFKARFTPTDTTNYETVENINVSVAVGKAAARTLADIPVSQKYTVDTEQSKNIGAAGMPAAAGTLTYTAGSSSVTTGTATVSGFTVDSTGVVKYTITGGTDGAVIKLPVTIGSDNYENSTVNVVITLTNKDTPIVTADDITVTYDGNAIPASKITGTADVAGTWEWKTGMAVTNVTDSGTKTVVFKPTDSANYAEVEKTINVTINKATPTGEPTYTKITTSGKTLADAGLTVTGGTFSVPGTVKWMDDAGADLADTTPVTANTYYKWLFTPTDTANYNTHTGSIKLYAKSSGGGGGSYTPSYTVSVDKTENGTITVSPKSASKGDTVTITVKPDKGYELEMLKALDKDGDALKLTEKNGKYTFKMPSGKVTVKGSFVEEAPVQIFKDVPVDAYYYEAVKWAAEKGITGGVGNGLFAPNQPCTRAQIVTFLWRAAGSPAPKHMSSFTDVPADAFYAKAVAWAVENGITGGTGDGKFSPDATCTRAQSVTFLYRASGSPAVSGSAAFSDVAANAYYADAVKWAEKNGITGGIGGGLFGSGNDCTRAQIVTFLYRNYQSK